MRIHYVCHACLLIETGDAKLATDPWFEGPAYCGQWHVFPRPVETQMLDQAQAIIISHAHEDHLHEPTLQRFSKGNRIFYIRRVMRMLVIFHRLNPLNLN